MLSPIYYTPPPVGDLSSPLPKIPVEIGNLIAPYSVDIKDLEEILDKIGELRVRAWRAAGMTDERHFKTGKWIDKVDSEKSTYHFVVYTEGQKIIAASRLRIFTSLDQIFDEQELLLIGDKANFIQPPIAKLERLVVDPEYQNQGLAKALIKARIQYALELEAISFVTDADLKIRNTFTEMGFKELGQTESFDPCGDITFPSYIFGALSKSILQF